MPDWTELRFIRHRGVNGSLKIQPQNKEELKNLLLTYGSHKEFRKVKVFVVGRVTPYEAVLEWLGNGSMVVLEDGFIVCECTGQVEAPILSPRPVQSVPRISTVFAVESTPVASSTLIQKVTMTKNTAPVIPEYQVVNENIVVINGRVYQRMAPTVVAPAPAPVAVAEPKVKAAAVKLGSRTEGRVQHQSRTHVQPEPKARVENKYVNRSDALILELQLPSQQPEMVIRRLIAVSGMLMRALESRTMEYGFVLRKTATIAFSVKVRGKEVYSKTFCAKEGRTSYALNGKTYFGEIPEAEMYKETANQLMDVLNRLHEHSAFADAILPLNTRFHLGDTDVLNNIPRRPLAQAAHGKTVMLSKDERELLRGVFGSNPASPLHDTYTDMWHKLTKEKDAVDALLHAPEFEYGLDGSPTELEIEVGEVGSAVESPTETKVE